MASTDLTAARLRELLHYDPETGVFTSRTDFIGKGFQRKAGEVAGSPHNKGYWHIAVDSKRYLAHRLAWLYMTGAWPEKSIDHINGDKRDNRWSNLRDVSHFINMQNMHSAKGERPKGDLGVTWRPRFGRWYAQITANGKYRFLGSFKDKQDAINAYLTAKAKVRAFKALET